MAQEEHTSRYSNSSSGGGGGGGGGDGSRRRSTKKLKHKKVPQRGLGVAQLEKIISEQRLKNDENSFEGEKESQNQSQSQTRFTAASQGNLGGFCYESNPPIWHPAPNLMLQRSQHVQQPFSSSSMVNVSAGTSSSILNFQMEPPSNQSYCGNNYHNLWPDEEKMVGIKRPYPLLLENRPIPSLQSKFQVSGPDVSASCSNGGISGVESVHPSFGKNPSSSGAISKKFIDENQVMTRDFLKLAPPQDSSNSSSQQKLYLSPCIGEQIQFEILPPHKGQAEDPSHLSGRSGPNVPRFHGFFPAERTPMGQQETNNGDAGESVDLNLKL